MPITAHTRNQSPFYVQDYVKKRFTSKISKNGLVNVAFSCCPSCSIFKFNESQRRMTVPYMRVPNSALYLVIQKPPKKSECSKQKPFVSSFWMTFFSRSAMSVWYGVNKVFLFGPIDSLCPSLPRYVCMYIRPWRNTWSWAALRH